MFNSSNSSNSISIPVSDDDSDDYTARMRVRVRRKRRKSANIRSNTELTRRIVRKLAKWWPLLLFLPAMALLLFEASRLGRKPIIDRPNHENNSDWTRERLSSPIVDDTNLNHSKPVYHRVAGGGKERKSILIA